MRVTRRICAIPLLSGPPAVRVTRRIRAIYFLSGPGNNLGLKTRPTATPPTLPLPGRHDYTDAMVSPL